MKRILLVMALLAMVQGCLVAPVPPSNSEEAVAYVNQGMVCHNEGGYDAAIVNFSKAIELNPKYVEAYIRRGMAYSDRLSDTGDMEAALRDLNKAIEIDPKNVLAYWCRGVTYHRLSPIFSDDIRNYSEAVWDYTKAIDVDPTFADAYWCRGEVYNMVGDLEAALRDFDKAIELAPVRLWSCYEYRGDIYTVNRDYDAAIRDYEKVVELSPDYANTDSFRQKHAMPYMKRGHESRRKGDFDAATRDYDKAIELVPRLADDLNSLRQPNH